MMINEAHERVSAVLDGELDPAEVPALIARLTADAGLRSRWSRYHLISDALHSNLPAQLDLRFAERVAQALATEPTVLAPRRAWREGLRPYLTQVASVAVAAGVALAAIVTLPVLVRDDPAATRAPHVAADTRAAPAGQMSLVAQRVPVQSRLSEVLVNHYENGGVTSVQGMLPYVRIVGYDPSRR